MAAREDEGCSGGKGACPTRFGLGALLPFSVFVALNGLIDFGPTINGV